MLGKSILQNVFFFNKILKCALRCEDGVHRVDFQTLKKLKNFQNLLNLFFQPHNGI